MRNTYRLLLGDGGLTGVDILLELEELLELIIELGLLLGLQLEQLLELLHLALVIANLVFYTWDNALRNPPS